MSALVDLSHHAMLENGEPLEASAAKFTEPVDRTEQPPRLVELLRPQIMRCNSQQIALSIEWLQIQLKRKVESAPMPLGGPVKLQKRL